MISVPYGGPTDIINEEGYRVETSWGFADVVKKRALDVIRYPIGTADGVLASPTCPAPTGYSDVFTMATKPKLPDTARSSPSTNSADPISSNGPESVWDSSQHVERDGSSGRSLLTPVTRSRLLPDEANVGRGFTERPVSGTESTMELMANVSKVDSRCSSSSLASTAIDAVSTVSVEESTQREVYTMPIELATRRTEDTELSWTTTKETIHHQSVEPTRLQTSAQDIEMTHMTFPRPGMESTEKLVPAHKERKLETISSWGNSSASASVAGAKSEAPTSPGELPDYKPITLRWPFQLLLVVIIAGTFAFFEYQIQNLPPVRYKMFHVNPPEQNRWTSPSAVEGDLPPVEGSTGSYLGPSPVTRIPNVAPTTVQTAATMRPAVGLGPGIRIAAPIPDPTPAPRPPESEYPAPIARTSTYCGWAPPVWVLSKRVKYPSYSNGQGVGTPMTGLNIEQTFPTFWSKNDSWCPCLVEVDTQYPPRWWTSPQWRDWPWTSGWATRVPGPDFYVSTHDKECRSVLSALYHFNTERWTTFVSPGDLLVSVNVNELSTDLTVSEHPVSQVPWPWPVTGSEGQVSVPFFVGERAKLDWPEGPPSQDDFGNTDLSDFYLNAWTSTSEGLSLMWWTLPFAQFSVMPSTPVGMPVTTSAASISSTVLPVSSDEQTTAIDTETETETEIRGRSSSTLEPSIVEGSSTDIEGGPVSTWTDDGTDTVTSKETETGEQTTVATATSAVSDISRPNGVGTGTTSGGHGGEEQNTSKTKEVSVPTTGIITSLSAVSEGPLKSTTAGHAEPTGDPPPSNVLLSSFSSHDSTTLLTSSRTQTNSEQVNSVETPKDQNTTTVLAHHSTPYSIHVHPGPKIAFSSSGSDGVFSSSANGTVAPVSSPTTTARFQGAHPPGANDQVPTPPPTTNPSGPIPPGSAARFTNLHTEADFLMASLFPVLLATILATAVQVFTNSLSSMLPFRGLAHGAQLGDSLMLPRNTGILTIWPFSIRFLRRHHDPLPLLNGLLTLLSIVLVPVSSEAIKLEISTTCRPTNGRPTPGLEDSPLVVCAFGLRKSGVTMRLSEGILLAMAVLIIALGYILVRWKTGVATEPWSVASIAALMSDTEIRDIIDSIPRCASNGTAHLRDKEIRHIIGEGRQFRLGYHRRSAGSSMSSTDLVYGIYAIPVAGCDSSIRLTTRDPSRQGETSPGHGIRWWKNMKHSTTDSIIRGIAAILTTGLLVLILFYENTIGPSTKFEEFMNSQSFGVRILFTALGTAIGWFWDEYFSRMSSHTIYQRLACEGKPQPAQTSILLSSQPADPFTAIYRSVTPALDIPLLSIAVARLLAKLTPILFSGIPFRNTITFTMHEACTWMSIAILFIMLCVLLQGLLSPFSCSGRRRKQEINMPVGVDTIAGCMYYLAGSTMLKDFEGLSMMRTRERDRLVCEMGRKYAFRRIPGNCDRDNGGRRRDEGKDITRIRVDYVEAFGEGASHHPAR